MTVIAANGRTARNRHWCVACNRKINPGDPYVSAFGHADCGETPYRVAICVGCARQATSQKVADALFAVQS